LPPVVEAGLLNTPIFMDLVDEDDDGAEREMVPVSLRSACDISPPAAPSAARPFALDPARHQGGDRVDHEHVDGAAAHQGLGDLERLLAVVGPVMSRS
jgi:hypothetical protein